VPRFDPYTYTIPGSRWIDIHWLHQLGLHGLYSLGGHDAVVWAKAALVVAVVAILSTIGYRRERPYLTAAAFALMLIIISDRIMPRPELPTFVCLAAVLALLERYQRRGDAWVYAIFGVQLVWVNLHGLFAVGIAICGIYLASEVLRPLLVPDQSLRRDRVRRLAAVTALAVLASFANPNFIDGALYPVQQLDMVGPVDERGTFGSIVAELVPPLGGEQPLNSLALAFVFALAALSFSGMALNWRRLQGSDVLLWVAFLYLALGAKRNLSLFGLVAAPIAVRNWNEVLDARAFPAWMRRGLAAATAAALAFGVVDVARGKFFGRVGTARQPGFGVMEVFFPIAQADWIAENRPPGPIAHHMSDGGYLIWRLWPDYRVMTDGRLEVYGAKRFMELQGGIPERFRGLDEEYRFGAVLVHHSLVASDDLLRWLYFNSNWKMVSVDEVAVLFVRASDEESWPEVDIDSPELFASLDGVSDGDFVVRMKSRANFYNALRRPKRALEAWEQGVAADRGIEDEPVIHATLLYKAGFAAAAEAILQQELEARPDDPELHTQVGTLRVESGDTDDARERFERALALDPRHTAALYQRGLLAEREGDLEMATDLYLRVLAVTNPMERAAVLARQRLAASGQMPLIRE
jgi:tetratricopeptide (TPR) repeat protein